MPQALRRKSKDKIRRTLRRRVVSNHYNNTRKNLRDDRLSRISRKTKLQQLLLDDLTVIVENVFDNFGFCSDRWICLF